MKRVWEIDVLRGFALFGVLLVNVVAFNTTLYEKAARVSPLADLFGHERMLEFLSAVFIHVFA